MNLASVDFDGLPVNRLFQTYLKDYSELSGFYSSSPFDSLRHNGTVSGNSGQTDRGTLVTLLTEINRKYGAKEEALSQIERLSDPEARVVVTGQQMAVFGGSLFLMIKAVSVILWARRMERETGKPVIPVFWLADEDHDMDEIARLQLPSEEGIATLSLEYDTGSRFSIGDIEPMKENLRKLREQVFEYLPETGFTSELNQLLSECYAGGSLQDGFANLITRFFSHHGLVLAESNNSEIKQELSEPLCKAVEQAGRIHDYLEQRSSEIEAKFHRQAQVQASTLFMHHPEKGRLRLDRYNGNWSNEAGEWTTGELCEIARNEPWRLSPNVFMRPIIQDWLLPTAGYVAGPAEVAYYAQLGEVYSIFNQQMPVILPRYSATFIEPAIERIMSELPFTFSDYSRRIEDLEKSYLEAETPDNLEELFRDWQERVEAITEDKLEVITKYDPSLKGSAEKMTVNYTKSIDKLYQKLRKSLRQRDEIQLKRIHRIKDTLFPEDKMQERVISWLYFSNKFGLDLWDELLRDIEHQNKIPDKHWLIYL